MYILIVGVGEVGEALAISLSESRQNVVCVDQSQEVCTNLYARHGIETHCGGGTDIEILRNARIEKADVAVGTMSSDADNLAFTVLAKQFGVPRVIVRVRDNAYEDAFRSAGATRLVSLVDVVLGQLILEIEEPDVRAVATFGGGKASIVILNVPDEWGRDGTSVAEIASSSQFPEGCVITGIFREASNEFVIPRGGSKVHSGDQLFLASDFESLKAVTAFFKIKPPRSPQ